MKNRVIILSFSIAAFFSFQACRADLRNAASEINMLKTDHFSYIDYSTQTEEASQESSPKQTMSSSGFV